MLLRLRVLRSTNRGLHTTRATASTVGIRAEDPARRWERRAPLTPSAVAQLVAQGARVKVQPCEKRVFPDHAYAEAGAEVTSSLADAKIILGIKEIPALELQPNSTHLFFSHTHRGQAYNLPLLQAMIDSGSRFVDWELLTDESGVRTTAFGWLAGVAGMSDGLSQFATKALARGSATPFLHLPRPYMAESLENLKESLRAVGKAIQGEGTPSSLGPITVVLSGKGRVGAGARYVLDQLPTQWVSATQLQNIVESSNPGLRKIYACQLELGDYLSNSDGSTFDREVYRSRPEVFFSEFETKIAPWTTVLLNGGFWQAGCPRILTTSQLARIQQEVPFTRFLSVVDVSCDFGGGLEFVTAPTTIDSPVVQFDATSNTLHADPGAPITTQISSIEILPSELPLDASRHFSNAILPYVSSLLHDPKSMTSSPHSRALRRATIVEGGKLGSDHSKLYDLLASAAASVPAARKRVLMLGSGLVAAPAVKVLAARADVNLVIASNSLDSATALAAGHERVSAVLLDASDRSKLENMIAEADVVVSLLPAPLHVDVAKICIRSGTSMVTASYVSPEMSELNESAKAAGVVLLNELGLDPGIDHCSAMRLIQEARDSGNKITSFVSFCGGLPSPEQSNEPLGYKFSWSPRGVLTAALNDAVFRIKSRDVSIPGKDLLRLRFDNVPIIRGFQFEGVANRNSVAYLEQYGLPADLPTILRGTLRYPTFSSIVDVFKRIGLLDQTVLPDVPRRWQDLTDSCLRRAGFAVADEAARRVAVSTLVPGQEALVDLTLDTLRELALIPDSNVDNSNSLPPLPTLPQSPLDLLSTLLAAQLKYGPDERDAVILHHELCTVSSTSETELFTSTLVQYGVPGSDSAMATTVGMPIALGALLCLDGKIKQRGLVSPASVEVWKPLLAALEENGLKLVEKRKKGTRGVLETLEKQISEM